MAIEQRTMSAPIFLQHTKEDAAILARNIDRAVAYAKADRRDAGIMQGAQEFYLLRFLSRVPKQRPGELHLIEIRGGGR